ncbi:hypothetical protein BDB01DRAFT_799079 [Pilobolus umbonatus]|nr:hypothetical protein BDB01DRAFT_799079 [Pilobolus umbonatus]
MNGCIRNTRDGRILQSRVDYRVQTTWSIIDRESNTYNRHDDIYISLQLVFITVSVVTVSIIISVAGIIIATISWIL